MSAAIKLEHTARVIPLLTKPKEDDNYLYISGHEQLAESIRTRQMELDSLAAQQKIAKQQLVQIATDEWRKAQENGSQHTSCAIKTSTKPVFVVYQDRFSETDIAHEPSLRQVLGDSYDQVVDKGVKLKARKGLTLDWLQSILGDKFAAFTDVVKCTEFIKPKKGFSEARSRLRHYLDTETNQAIDDMIDQIRYAPQVRVK